MITDKLATADKQPTEDKRAIGKSGLPVPRFVSLKSNKINVRRGPGAEYPILWQFQKRGLPVEIIAEYQHWRHIRDHEGGEGWINASLLSGKRRVMIRHQQQAPALRRTPHKTARIRALLETGVIADINKCRKNWCKIKTKEQTGWVLRTALWGIYPFEFQN